MTIVTTKQGHKFDAPLFDYRIENWPEVRTAVTGYIIEIDECRTRVQTWDGLDFTVVVKGEAMSSDRVKMAYDIVNDIRRQLPLSILENLRIEIRSDPFHLRTQVRFTTGSERVIDCELETEQKDGRLIACKLPDLIVARLCVEV